MVEVTGLDLVVKGGKVVAGGRTFPGWVAIAGGKVVAIGKDTPPEARRVIDVGGKHVLPGLVDPEWHIGMYGWDKDLASETRAAAAAGVTTWGWMNTSVFAGTSPIPHSRPEDVPTWMEVFPRLMELGENNSTVDYFFSPRITNDRQAAEIPELAEKWGVTSYKTQTHLRAGEAVWDIFPPARMGGQYSFDDGMIYMAMKNVASIGPPGIYCLHCENWEIARVIQRELQAKGRNDMGIWSERSPAFCEAGHVRAYAYYAKITGCPIYIMHVTTPETVAEIVKAKTEGVTIYGQTGPHYLALPPEAGRINVPLRDEEAREACWEALSKGLIDCIGSDHISRGDRSREVMWAGGNPWKAHSGMPSGVEAMLPVMITEGVHKGRITLERLVEIACENPARIFGLYPKKGAITIGADADLVVVDLDRPRKVTPAMIVRSGGWSIWEGHELRGWPVLAIFGGEVIMEWPEGAPGPKITDERRGRYISRQLGHKLYPID